MASTNRALDIGIVALSILVLAVAGFMSSPLFHRTGGRPAKQATCTQNLNTIGKAFRMYACDWDDTLPTNKSGGARRRFLSRSCRLNDPSKLVGAPINQYSLNFVEAFSPYLEKLEDIRGQETIWRCPKVSERQGLSSLKQELPGVTYSMNWYMAEQRESKIGDAPNTLLMREIGKPSQSALLRPHPSSLPNARHPNGSGPPVHMFPSAREFGADTVGPVIHNEGSIVLFADGHVSYRKMNILNGRLVSEPTENGTVRWRVGDTSNGGIWITP